MRGSATLEPWGGSSAQPQPRGHWGPVTPPRGEGRVPGPGGCHNIPGLRPLSSGSTTPPPAPAHDPVSADTAHAPAGPPPPCR